MRYLKNRLLSTLDSTLKLLVVKKGSSKSVASSQQPAK